MPSLMRPLYLPRFDVFEFGNINAREDEDGMLKTVHALNQLITAEVDAGIPANRIVLGGFSQGAAMSLLTGLTTERRLAGLGILSGWLPIRNKVKAVRAFCHSTVVIVRELTSTPVKMVSDHAKKLPIFWGHGTADPIVRFDRATMSLEFLKTQLGVKTVDPDAVLGGGIEFHAYEDLPHSADPEELDELKMFLKKVIPVRD